MAPSALDTPTTPPADVPGAPLNAGMPAGLPEPGTLAPTPGPSQEPIGEPPPSVDMGELPPSITSPDLPALPPLPGAKGEKPPIVTAAEVFSEDLGDYIDRDLLDQLKASAADEKMDAATAIGFAGLAMTNPELLGKIMDHRANKQTNARSLLTQLQGQISTARRTAITAEAAVNKAQLSADEAGKRMEYQANAKGVGDLAASLHRRGLKAEVPQPVGQDLYDHEKVAAFMASGNGVIETDQQRGEDVDKQFAVIQKMAAAGGLKPELVPKAMHEVLRNAGYTEAEISSKFSAQLMLAQSAATSMKSMKEAERAKLGAVRISAEQDAANVDRKLSILEKQVDISGQRATIDQQEQLRLGIASLGIREDRLMSWADTAADPNSKLATDSANAAARLAVQRGEMQKRLDAVTQRSEAMGLERSVDSQIGKAWKAGEVAAANIMATTGSPEKSTVVQNSRQAAIDAAIANIKDEDIKFAVMEAIRARQGK